MRRRKRPAAIGRRGAGRRTAGAAILFAVLVSRAGAASRPPVQGCAWEKLSDASVGLEVSVQRCRFGTRTVDFLFQRNSLAIRFSDGGPPDPVVDVLDLAPGETPETGVRRLFAARTEPGVAARCVLARPRGAKAPAGVRRFTFIPDAGYRRELERASNPDEVGTPPCGAWGESPDGIQYFETHPRSPVPKVLFVRAGQDEPLFDEESFRLIGPRAPGPR